MSLQAKFMIKALIRGTLARFEMFLDKKWFNKNKNSKI